MAFGEENTQWQKGSPVTDVNQDLGTVEFSKGDQGPQRGTQDKQTF